MSNDLKTVVQYDKKRDSYERTGGIIGLALGFLCGFIIGIRFCRNQIPAIIAGLIFGFILVQVGAALGKLVCPKKQTAVLVLHLYCMPKQETLKIENAPGIHNPNFIHLISNRFNLYMFYLSFVG